MHIINRAFNLFFPPIPSIRERLFELEKHLGSLFSVPFTLLPIPNEAPPELPRITAITPHGFSSLNVTLNSFQFATNYSEDFSRDWGKCVEYINSHIFKVCDALQPFFSRILFSGLTLNLLLHTQEKNAVEVLADSFLKTGVHANIYDFMQKYTFVSGNSYYINIQMQNQRLPQIQPNFFGSLKDFEASNRIGITLDINDRYSANYTPGYFSNAEKIRAIIDLSGDIITNKLESFVTTGEIKI